jgi:hypothetical protein
MYCDLKFRELIIGSRDCLTGIVKSMTLSYVPPREFKDDPLITLALFSPTPMLTLLDYNFARLPIDDVKGFEVIVVLFASVFNDILKTHQTDGQGLATTDVKRETQRLQKLEEKEEERARRQKAEEIERETERLRKLSQQEYMEKKRRDEQVAKETERLRWQEGWYNTNNKPPLPPKSPLRAGKKKHWWSSTAGQPSQNGYQGNWPQYGIAGGA